MLLRCAVMACRAWAVRWGSGAVGGLGGWDGGREVGGVEGVAVEVVGFVVGVLVVRGGGAAVVVEAVETLMVMMGSFGCVNCLDLEGLIRARLFEMILYNICCSPIGQSGWISLVKPLDREKYHHFTELFCYNSDFYILYVPF